MWSREDWNSVTKFAPVPLHPRQILLAQQQFADVKLGLFLGALAKLRKATCVYSPLCVEQLGSHWLNFHEIWYLSTFCKSVRIQVKLKSDKNNVYFMQIPTDIYNHVLLISS
jgi:hypothetical protein